MPLREEDLAPEELEIPDSLRKILIPEGEPESQIAHTVPKGRCPIHGEVGWARMVLFNPDPTFTKPAEVISEHCMHCMSRIFTDLVGVLEYDEEE